MQGTKLKFRQSDLIIAGALLMMLATLIIPVPTAMLDIMLVMSISMSILVIVMTTQINDSLQLSSFPSLVLLMTLFRLSLNVATTRQILLNGFAGKVIQSFGDFVVGGNYVVGIVVFLILVIINFMVITKGSGRIAEVTARFTLDAMPGKQMSIDADLNAGLIDEKQALARREKLGQEADFYGAMDGASKFVKGDAVAGLIITIINIAGGFTIGMLQQNMSAGEALKTYTILTVGDGLVAQIPALVMSTAAGMLVTQAASENTLGSDIAKQLFQQKKPLLITGSILTAVALVPGLPFIPFMILGGTIGSIGLFGSSREKTAAEELDAVKQGLTTAIEADTPASLPASGAKEIPQLSQMDLEIGFGLVPLVDRNQGGKLIDRIAMIRHQIAEELGFSLPPVNVRDNIELKNTDYRIKIRGLDVASGFVRPGSLLAINPGAADDIKGFTKFKEPAFGFDSYWIPKEKTDMAESKGMTVVDCASVITTHLAEEAKKHASSIINRQDVSNMIDQLKETHSSVIEELIPNKMTIGGVHQVLQALLKERASIRDLPLILETLADHSGRTQDTGLLVEFCRRSLGGHICSSFMGPDGTIKAIGNHPDLDRLLTSAVHSDSNDIGSIILEPTLVQRILEAIRDTLQAARAKGHDPILLCSPLIRPQLRRLTFQDLSDLAIISFAEVPENSKVEMVGMIPSPENIVERLEPAA